MSRNTLQKEIISNIVKGMMTHPSPDEVYNEVHKNYPSIGRATVYRVLNKLADKGEIKKVSIPDSADRFDFRTDDHIHMRCRCCNKVFDADFEGSKELLTHIDEMLSRNNIGTQGFESQGAHISFYGICEDCRNSQQQ
ncbi:MAG: transcriptional repressor [Bacillota bacterium]|nr:transcriptional repressor [Bacillota bacterium]